MAKISVIITAYNAEEIIKRCLESVKWADEIIFVDLESSDKTLHIAKQYTKHIFSHKNIGYVEPVRNFSISKAHGDWILILDADEEVPASLSEKLQAFTAENSLYTYVKIPRKNIIFGKWIQHTGWWPDHLIRFFKKGSVQWKDEVHSVPKISGEGYSFDGEENALVHYHYSSVMQFFHRNFETYARIEAENKLNAGYVFNYADAIRFPMSEFLRRYFFWEGYKDGLHGLVLSLFMAFYHFAVFCYLWEKNKFIDISSEELENGLKKELRRSKKEIQFWIYTKKINMQTNNVTKLLLKFRKKFL
jgi:glycosyltransferase involved in cell wall biosynthesis